MSELLHHAATDCKSCSFYSEMLLKKINDLGQKITLLIDLIEDTNGISSETDEEETELKMEEETAFPPPNKKKKI